MYINSGLLPSSVAILLSTKIYAAFICTAFSLRITFVRTTEKHKVGITRFLTGCELRHFRYGPSVATPPYQDVYDLGIVYRVLHRFPQYS